MSPDARLRATYGGIKPALEYCVALRMNKTQAALFLAIDRKTLRKHAIRFGVVFPDGYTTQDRSLSRERMAEQNAGGKFIRRCKTCGHANHPRQAACKNCGAAT